MGGDYNAPASSGVARGGGHGEPFLRRSFADDLRGGHRARSRPAHGGSLSLAGVRARDGEPRDRSCARRQRLDALRRARARLRGQRRRGRLLLPAGYETYEGYRDDILDNDAGKGLGDDFSTFCPGCAIDGWYADGERVLAAGLPRRRAASATWRTIAEFDESGFARLVLTPSVRFTGDCTDASGDDGGDHLYRQAAAARRGLYADAACSARAIPSSCLRPAPIPDWSSPAGSWPTARCSRPVL